LRPFGTNSRVNSKTSIFFKTLVKMIKTLQIKLPSSPCDDEDKTWGKIWHSCSHCRRS
jgi:hypothetical protein